VAVGTITSLDGKLVLLKRGIEPAYGKWVFPGGFVDRGERVEEAAIRETREEIATCRPFLVRELDLLARARVVVALGKIGFDAYLAACAASGVAIPRPRPAFGHRCTHRLPNGVTLIGSYHPSRQNTQTGRLTAPMLAAIFTSARRIIDTPRRKT